MPDKVSVHSVDSKVNVLVRIPEAPNFKGLNMEEVSTTWTFKKLCDECLKDEVVPPLKQKVARHFWEGNRMLLRANLVDSLFPTKNASHTEKADLTLRPDFYLVRPGRLIQDGVEYRAVDAEEPVSAVLASILAKSEDGRDQTCCYRLCNHRGRPLRTDKSLVALKCWPAEWSPGVAHAPEALPEHARLLIRRHVSLLPRVVFAVTCLLGILIGYWLIAHR